MKKLPLGIQTFKDIIHGEYVYADKTQYVYSLMNDARYYFLSRPRRFGKSLLLDTIAEAFGGCKELFKGLAIYDSDFTFEKHPVLRLDMSSIANDTPEILRKSLMAALRKRINDEDLNVAGEIPSDLLQFLIEALYRKYGKRVVVLTDEYDKPILDRLNDTETADANRDVLRGFYGVLKSMDPYLRLTFITGVTKFTKTSVFSGLNNLYDITMVEKYANICGIAIEDLSACFGDHIDSLASLIEFNHIDSLHDKILEWYDGYSWDGEARVLNPFSLLSFFAGKRFSGFWYASGTPKFLLDMIKRRPKGYTDLRNPEMGEWSLDTFDIQRIEVEPLLFQTGYLTVKEVVPETAPPVFLLEIPNFEVRMAFNLHILAEFTESGAVFAESSYHRLMKSLKSGDLQGMLETMRALFASIPYQLHIKREAYYHSIFYAIISLLGFDMDAEVSVAVGRIDATLELEEKVYIMEFKYVDCPKDIAPEERRAMSEMALDEGMRQIKGKRYADKFKGCGKTIYTAAFAFLGREDIEMRTCHCERR